MEALKEALRPVLALPYVPTLLGLTILIGGAWLANWLLRTVIRRVVTHLVRNTKVQWDDYLFNHSVLKRAVNVVPAMLIHRGIAGVPGLPSGVVTVVEDVALSMVVLSVAAVRT
mgnify:CR=1 FL=1